jgi:putative tryptophan/tyrosine transport system permease protein
MSLLLGAMTIGLILSLLALGVFISFRIFDFPDITADGSSTLGAAVAAAMIVKGANPLAATAAGSITGVLAAKFKINGLLAGILVMTGLYSVNLHIMGRSNVPLFSSTTLSTYAQSLGVKVFGGQAPLNVFGWEVSVLDASTFLLVLLSIVLVGGVLFWFFQTNLGTAMRATGDNSQMIRALGVSDENMVILGLAVSNGLIGLAGAFLAQYQGFADVQMGIGMVVWGLASVIIGEALVGVRSLGLMIVGAVMGSVLFRLLVAIALRMGLDPNDLKLITAIFVFLALVLPGIIKKLKPRKTGLSGA